MSEELDDIVQIDQAYVERVYAQRNEEARQNDESGTFKPRKAPLLFKPGEYVIIKREMTAGDDIWIHDHMVRSSGKSKDVTINVLIGTAKLVSVQRMVRGWNILREVLDPSGQVRQVPLPFSVNAVEKLPRRIFNFIADEIERLNPGDEELEMDDEGSSPLSLQVIDSTEDSPGAVRMYHRK